MAEVVWTEPALADLDRIAEYISLDDHLAAARLVKQVFRRIDQLEQFPELGPCPRELRGTEYRHLVVKPLRIFYRVESEQVFILFIMRGERLFLFSDLVERDP